MTITDAAAAMSPPMPRRELARRLKGVTPTGVAWGRGVGRRPAVYSLADILRAHAEWVRDRRAVRPVGDG